MTNEQALKLGMLKRAVKKLIREHGFKIVPGTSIDLEPLKDKNNA